MTANAEIEIDVPDRVWDAVAGCEIYCEAACCGEHAFELLPEYMKPWLEQARPQQIAQVRQDLDHLIAELTRLGPTARLKWFSGKDPNGPKGWLEEVRECLLEATTPPATQVDGSPMFRHATANVRVLTADEVHLGYDFPPKPLKSGRLEVLLPEGRLAVIVSLAADQLVPGQEGAANLRFPLPRRIQSFLKAGASLDLALCCGSKHFQATIVEPLA